MDFIEAVFTKYLNKEHHTDFDIVILSIVHCKYIFHEVRIFILIKIRNKYTILYHYYLHKIVPEAPLVFYRAVMNDSLLEIDRISFSQGFEVFLLEVAQNHPCFVNDMSLVRLLPLEQSRIVR